MSGFGDAAAAISLTIELFNLCVDGLCTISRAKHSHESLLDFNTRLDLEIARLVLWGRNAGLDRNELDASLEPVQPLLTRILSAVSSSIQDADHLKASYGLGLVEEAPAGKNPKTQSRSSSFNERLDILSIPQISSGIQQQQMISFQLKKRTGLYKKAKWALWDEEKAIRFVETVKGYVDGLNKLLTESQKAALDAETTAMRIAILGINYSQPAKMLSTIESATLGRYDSLALPARLARFRLELELEEAAPSLSSSILPFVIPLPIPYDQLQPLDVDRSLAIFQSRNVLVEWRNLTASEVMGETGKARKQQAAKLAAVIHQLETHTAEYRVLDCIGYIDQLDHRPPRLGTVFDISKSTSPSNPAKKPLCSLYEYISSRDFENFEPPLGARFELARNLTQGFLQFHQSGWFHKNIRSHNIIFLREGENKSIESPFILGFGYSRPSQTGISDPVRGDGELMLYQHPKYSEESENGFKLQYDLFSIGLLLFEIAKWRPLKNYFTRLQRKDSTMRPSSFAAALVKDEKDELEFRVGTHYMTAVLTCINGTFEVEGDDPNNTRLKLAYFEKVVKNLTLCKA